MNKLNALNQSKFWIVVPAAGIGARMRSDRPKQYLQLTGKTVLEYTLDILLSHPRVEGLVVPISAHDTYWHSLRYEQDPRIISVEGGEERSDSVLNGLRHLNNLLNLDDWVLVHDVARPCVTHGELDLLFQASETDIHGAVLGMPVRDTMKQTNSDGVVKKTVDRSCLWHAFTPQMFRLGDLLSALEKSIDKELQVTDEASAMENMGYQPTMIAGNTQNIKITTPDDLRLARLILDEVVQGN